VAKFFYAGNVAFALANSASFAELVEAIKRAPLSYKAPDRHRFSEDLLEDAVVSAQSLYFGLAFSISLFGVLMLPRSHLRRLC
jgi:hypothetical protein